MQVVVSESLPIRSSEDVVLVRQAVRKQTLSLGFNLINQTKIVTAASELARNTFIHGGGGEVTVETVQNGTRQGVQMIFEDQGPGIYDIDQALKDGFTTGSGLGLGLGGAKRLSDEFEIYSKQGEGTRIRILRWKA